MERKFLIGIITIGFILCAILFIVNTIKSIIESGNGLLLVILVLILALAYPTGNAILNKLGGKK